MGIWHQKIARDSGGFSNCLAIFDRGTLNLSIVLTVDLDGMGINVWGNTGWNYSEKRDTIAHTEIYDDNNIEIYSHQADRAYFFSRSLITVYYPLFPVYSALSNAARLVINDPIARFRQDFTIGHTDLPGVLRDLKNCVFANAP
jgi:hypothetical protein